MYLYTEKKIEAMDVAMLSIRFTPGYVCRVGSKTHHTRYVERESTLHQVEEELQSGLSELKPLVAAKADLLRTEKELRQHRYLQTAIRTAVCGYSYLRDGTTFEYGMF